MAAKNIPENRFRVTTVNAEGDCVEDGKAAIAASEDAPVAEGETEEEHTLALFEDDGDQQKTSLGFVSDFVRDLWSYEGGLLPSTDDIKKQKVHRKSEKANLGTLLGVFFPCVQNIFGVLFFIRMVWIVGTAGWLQALIIAAICCSTTLTTSISLSAIATNGVVPGGGSYFLISRNLGPEFGGAVGILFYIGNSFAAAMYIIGAVEIFFNYYPFAKVIAVNDLSDPEMFFANYRLYGTILLIMLLICVIIGVRFVSKFAPVSLVCVLFSIFCVYVGVFSTGSKMNVCYVNGKLMRSAWLDENAKKDAPYINSNLSNFNLSESDNPCSVCPGSAIFKFHCKKFSNSSEFEHALAAAGFHQSSTNCTYQNASALKPYCGADFQQLIEHENSVNYLEGIGPISKDRFLRNLHPLYADDKDRLIDAPHKAGNFELGDVVTDGMTTFFILLATFFPSVTGIMAGSNRSGDLKDAQKSIPLGTIGAVIVTTAVYLSGPLLFAATIEGPLLRDKFGDSIDKKLVIASLAWPNEWVVLIGSLLATIGAGLQTLVGAPRLLQAVAKDGVVPVLAPFMIQKRGEPLYAQLLTASIVEIGILIAKVDDIAPILTMFFLMCYAFVNLACALQTLLKAPSWRPRFRFYHWSLSIVGFLLCAFIMFSTYWYYALLAIGIAIVVYKYIEYKGAEKDWGDGLKGLQMNAARFALLKLEDNPPHVKNWRPQCLVLLKPNDDLTGPKYPKMLDFVRQLKYGRGLIILASVLPGRFTERADDTERYLKSLKSLARSKKLEAFTHVLVTSPVEQGFDNLVQVCGLGGMQPNTVVVGWPSCWRQSASTVRIFVELVRVMKLRKLALIVPKNIQLFHDAATRLVEGCIDVWWVVHDGGLLVLLQFLLKKHKTYAGCTLRVFAVAQLNDDSIALKRDLTRYFYQLRIKAIVQVVEMAGSDLSAYAYERTMRMQEQSSLMSQLKTGRTSVVRFKDDDGAEAPFHNRVRQFSTVVERDHESDGADAAAATAAASDLPADRLESAQSATVPLIVIGDKADTDSASADDDDVTDADVANSNDNGVAAQLFTFTPNCAAASELRSKFAQFSTEERRNYKRMHTAVGLNAKIRQHSQNARLVILNLPAPPKVAAGDFNYMEFVEVLVEGLGPALLVRGGGQEVVTIDS